VNRAAVGPVTIDVETIKEGSALTMMGARMHQDGRALLTSQAVFANPGRRMAEALIVAGAPPDIPPPEDCVLSTPAVDAPLPPPFVSKVDVYLHPDDVFLDSKPKAGPPRVRGWFRLKEGESPDPMSVVQATDAFPPAIFNSDIAPGWTPTIELTVHVREPGPFEWLKCEFRTRFVTGGWLEEDGELWDETGRLVAQSRQLALVHR
jgi:acyl-CoA thioesterase